MSNSSLFAVTPLDGRYSGRMNDLAPLVSVRKDRKIGKEILSGRQGEIDFGRPTIAIEIRNSSIRLIADCEL